MSQDNPTDETLSGDAQLTPADGEAAVSPDTLTLADLNSLLGKDFKDVETAKKALKDTQSYVGKKKEDIAAEVLANNAPAPQDSNLESEFKALKNDLFFTQNPQYKEYRSLIESMGTPAEVVESDAFKPIFEKVKAADEAEQNKSVVHSSPRIAQDKSVMDEAVKTANSAGATLEDVASVFAKSIVESES